MRECKYHDFAIITQPVNPGIKYQWQLTSQKRRRYDIPSERRMQNFL